MNSNTGSLSCKTCGNDEKANRDTNKCEAPEPALICQQGSSVKDGKCQDCPKGEYPAYKKYKSEGNTIERSCWPNSYRFCTLPKIVIKHDPEDYGSCGDPEPNHDPKCAKDQLIYIGSKGDLLCMA